MTQVQSRSNPHSSMEVPVSESSILEFKHDNALFFYRGKQLTIIELNDWEAIKSYLGGNKLSQTIKCAVISLAIADGYNTFYADRFIEASKGSTNKEVIENHHVISSGTHGVVYYLTFFNVVMKYYKLKESMFIELAVYELIQKAYENPEEMGLPRLLGHGSNYILIPYYPRTLKHGENDKIYNNLGKSIYSLHVLGVVHRDIKFSNVMVKENQHTILVDFGLSTWKVATSHRPPGSSIQTMWFRAPEVANDRKREFPTDYPSDWWSYGVILASKEKMLITSMTNTDLLRDLKKLFSNGRNVPDLGEGCEKYQLFLHQDPMKRLTGSEYLNISRITPELMLQYIPIANNIFNVTISERLINLAESWIEYFTIVDYLYYVSEEEALNFASIVIGGKGDLKNFDASRAFSKLEGNILRLNTFSILAMKYPVEKIIFHCLVLSLEGVHFPHLKQAEWIENTFLEGTESRASRVGRGTLTPEESAQIKNHYYKLLPIVEDYDLE